MKLAQEQEFVQHKSLLFSIVYNILGEVEEAKDIVQDSFESWLKIQSSGVKHPKAYLAKIVTHKAIDRLKALKKQRETYPGQWLPEPVVYPNQSDVQSHADILPYALLCTLEKLNPVERAVLILRESFDFDYEPLAEICGITQANCRQILHRAKEKVHTSKHRYQVDTRIHRKLIDTFLQACRDEDPEKLAQLLKDDIILYSDGGGKAAATMRPLLGATHIIKFLMGIARKRNLEVLTYEPVWVNNLPGVLLKEGEKNDTLIAFDTEGRQIRQLYIIRNPDKISLQ